MKTPAQPVGWFLCGGARSAQAPRDAVELSATGPDKNIEVDLDGISCHLFGRVPSQFVDLIFIAAYVLTADSTVRRGDVRSAHLNRDFQRDLHFSIAVNDPHLWSQPKVRALLERALGFLTDDTYSFEFCQAKTSLLGQMSFNIEGDSTWREVDDIALFSGGLDSLAGAIEALFGNPRKRLLLVSHRSADKVFKVQLDLVSELRRRADPGQVGHLVVHVVKKEEWMRRERTQRSRSFLFVALAGAVAHLLDRDRVLLYENGVVAMNLPISMQLLGANATRTAHPRALREFAELFSVISPKKIAVENPFALMTRPEVLQRITAHSMGSLIGKSVSCALVHNMETARPHCGTCSQCVDRQFGVRAGNVLQHDPQDRYRMQFVDGDRTEEIDRLLLIDYMNTASQGERFRDRWEFLNRHGEAAAAVFGLGGASDAALNSVFGMHSRHGRAVSDVTQAVYAGEFKALQAGEHSLNSLPMLINLNFLQRRAAVEKIADFEKQFGPAENLFCEGVKAWLIRFHGGKFYPVEDRIGMKYIVYLLRNAGKLFRAEDLIAAAAGRSPPSRKKRGTVGMTEATAARLRHDLKEIAKKRKIAEECDNESDIADCDAATRRIRQELRYAGLVKGKPRPETPEERQPRVAVSNAIDHAIKAIRASSAPLADHLKRYIQKGSLIWYTQVDMNWNFK